MTAGTLGTVVELPSRVRSGAIGRRAAAVVLALVVAAAFAAVRPPARGT